MFYHSVLLELLSPSYIPIRLIGPIPSLTERFMRPRTMAAIFINLYSQKNNCSIAEDHKKSWMNEQVKKVHTQEHLSARVGSYSKKASVRAKGRKEGAYNCVCERLGITWQEAEDESILWAVTAKELIQSWQHDHELPYLKDGGGGFAMLYTNYSINTWRIVITSGYKKVTKRWNFTDNC